MFGNAEPLAGALRAARTSPWLIRSRDNESVAAIQENPHRRAEGIKKDLGDEHGDYQNASDASSFSSRASFSLDSTGFGLCHEEYALIPVS